MWAVLTGSQHCQVVADAAGTAGACVTDGAGPHGNSEMCIISALQPMYVSTTSFSTESYYDYLMIGGTRYSGTNGPTGVTMATGTTVRWYADGSVSNEGFVLCGNPVANTVSVSLVVSGAGLTVASFDRLAFRNSLASTIGVLASAIQLTVTAGSPGRRLADSKHDRRLQTSPPAGDCNQVPTTCNVCFPYAHCMNSSLADANCANMPTSCPTTCGPFIPCLGLPLNVDVTVVVPPGPGAAATVANALTPVASLSVAVSAAGATLVSATTAVASVFDPPSAPPPPLPSAPPGPQPPPPPSTPPSTEYPGWSPSPPALADLATGTAGQTASDGTTTGGDNDMGLGLALGLGIPLVLLIIGLAVAMAFYQGKAAPAAKPSLELTATPVSAIAATSASAEKESDESKV